MMQRAVATTVLASVRAGTYELPVDVVAAINTMIEYVDELHAERGLPPVIASNTPVYSALELRELIERAS